MRAPLILVAALALTAAACDTGTSTADPEPAPTVTVTVTETPDPGPTATPVATGDPCDDLVGGETLAFVFVTSPAPGTMVSDGFSFSGCANAFEATYGWRLEDANGAVLANGFGTASCGTGCVGTFTTPVAFTVSQVQVGALVVFTSSAEDGSEQDVNVIPLVLQP